MGSDHKGLIDGKNLQKEGNFSFLTASLSMQGSKFVCAGGHRAMERTTELLSAFLTSCKEPLCGFILGKRVPSIHGSLRVDAL